MKGVEQIFHYFPELNQSQKNQFLALEELYTYWNKQINVISRKDIEELYTRHVLHSLGIAKVISFQPHTKILDVGCGGGFPGIPLAILFPECHFHLVDSIGKKIKVVNEVALALGLKNASGSHMRAEQVKERYHFVVSRAVTEFNAFYSWVRNKFEKENFNDLKNGIVYLKGGDLEEELRNFRNKVQLFHLKDYFKEDFFETKKVVYLAV